MKRLLYCWKLILKEIRIWKIFEVERAVKMYRGADKCLARPTSRCRRTESIVLLEIHAILREILGEHGPSYAAVKIWVAQFKRGYFSTFFPWSG
jgi:hypothetical protein